MKTVVGALGSFEIHDVDTELKIRAILLIKTIHVNTISVVCWTLFSGLHLIAQMQKWHTSRLESNSHQARSVQNVIYSVCPVSAGRNGASVFSQICYLIDRGTGLWDLLCDIGV